jgi:polyhydroxybutyrate depolymerase
MNRKPIRAGLEPGADPLPARTLVLLALLLASCARRAGSNALPLGRDAPALQPGAQLRTLQIGSVQRSYILHAPPGLDPARPAAVVLVFHGGGGNAENADQVTEFSSQADQSGFLAVYPNGSGRLGERLLTWNGGACCGYAAEQDSDDVGFVRSILDDLRGLAQLDETRVYAAGMSNGAIFAYRLACDMSETFAAIAPVAGTMNYEACQPSASVSILHIHGLDDRRLPYEGGIGSESLTGVSYASAEDSLAFWRDFDECPASAAVQESGEIVHSAYGPCRDGTAVELITIAGGGHAWPGGPGPAWPGGDQPTRDLDATRLIWEFFAAHPRSLP